jgi:hypothetical protein
VLGTVQDEDAALRFEVGHGAPVERLLCYSRESL